MPVADGGAGSNDSRDRLVGALEDEIDGLRQSARLRSVIEQAKGVLAERHGITLNEAFDRLREISQQQNARLVDVAATVLGLSHAGEDGNVPAVLDPELPGKMQPNPAMSAAWRSVREWTGARAGAVGVVVESLAAATEDGDVAAELLVDLAGLTQPDGVLIYAVRDDYLELLGSMGYPVEVMAAWTRIPLTLDIALTSSVRRRESEFFSSSEALLEAFPSLTQDSLYGYHSWFYAPVLDRAQATGLVVMGWESPREIDDVERQRLLALVNRTGPVFLRTLTGREPAKRQLAGLLRLSRDPWMVVVGASSPEDRAEESLVIEAVDPGIPGSKQWVGRRLLAAIPGLADQPALMQDLTRLLQDDALFVLTTDVAGTSKAPWDLRPGQLRAVRTGRRLVLTWRDDPA